jgi:transcription-repair coupling factor (superfamily II helicase)
VQSGELAKVLALVQRSKGGYRLTPEMKLVAILDPKKGSTPHNLLAATKRVLRDLLLCESED